jgi:hypothetical protein
VTSVVADSHAILWYVQGSDRLSEEASSALASAEVGDGIVVHVEPVDAVELGRAFMAELREPITDRSLDNKRPATDRLRWDGDELDDEAVWTAVMTAVQMADGENERWLLGDGVIDEQVATRPNLRERWRNAYRSDAAVRAVYAAMWEELDATPYGRGWWEEPHR